jgi:hypothetical protein
MSWLPWVNVGLGCFGLFLELIDRAPTLERHD